MATSVTLAGPVGVAIPTATVTTEARPRAVPRLLFLDNLRVFMTSLVIVFHLALTYGGEGSWYYLERPVDDISAGVLTLWVVLNQWFFMGLFFLVSGYFVPRALDRKGTWGFLRDRLIRLGIPLVLFTLLVSPLLEYVKAVQHGRQVTLVDMTLANWGRFDFAPGPLWFVETLLVFCVVYALGRAALRLRKPAQPQLGRPGLALSHRLMVGFALSLALASFATRLAISVGEEWNHLQLAFYPQYAGLFAAGILASRQGWLPEIPARIGRAWTIIALAAIVALPLILMTGGSFDNPEPLLGGLTWQSLALSTWEGFYSLGMSVLLLGLFRRRFDGQGRVARVMAANAYTAYIIHPLVIIPLAFLLSPVALFPLLKWAIVAPLGVALCFLASEYAVRRLPLATRVL